MRLGSPLSAKMEFLKRTLSIRQIFVINYFSQLRETDSEIPSKGTSPFTAMGEITVDPKGVLQLLNGLKVQQQGTWARRPEC